ncbi:MAG TPA: site-specific recombinase [Herbaspirillum sp.]|nr:site-specific recombinase [Herbaspirillum sp.]
MQAILDQIAANPDTDSIDALVALVDAVRPPRNAAPENIGAGVQALIALLQAHPPYAAALRHYLLQVLSTRRQTSLYTDVGTLRDGGFFTELFRRLSYRMLPPALDERYLVDCLDWVLPQPRDYIWMNAVPADDWLTLIGLLQEQGGAENDARAIAQTATQLLQAIQVLSYRISAIGTEPELIRIYTDVKAFESPFLMQNVELHHYLAAYMQDGDKGSNAPDADQPQRPYESPDHVLVMLDQCDATVSKIRKLTLRVGTSVALTYRLVRLTQNIERMRTLLSLVDRPQIAANSPDTTAHAKHSAALALGLKLVEAHNRKYAVNELLASNINLLARNITENASRTGEHYIAEDRGQYRAMLRSASGAGLIIGFMAVLKILASYLHAAPLVEAFLFSMNYSLGFMLIQVLHFTVATKQPAMTASRIAADVHSRDGRNIDLDSLVELLVKVIRTQFVAVAGNLLLAFPMAYLIAIGYGQLFGHALVTPDKARHLLQDIDPFTTLALFYAAIAGVCLFLAGLISGYYDNKALYTRMGQRIARLHWLNRWLGAARVARLGDYLETSLGGLMGNFYFGILLGCLGTIGFLFGLPLDIRHITFSAANFAIAMVGLDHQIGWHAIVVSTIGVLAIGTVNLWVSFSLALIVALRSRQVKFQHGTQLAKLLLLRFLKRPIDFMIAPKDAATAAATANAGDTAGTVDSDNVSGKV